MLLRLTGYAFLSPAKSRTGFVGRNCLSRVFPPGHYSFAIIQLPAAAYKVEVIVGQTNERTLVRNIVSVAQHNCKLDPRGKPLVRDKHSEKILEPEDRHVGF
jgi:hypothetical protein